MSFAFAGLWDTWLSRDSEQINTCTIVTCEPNELMSSIHSRMPVILNEEAETLWLNPEICETNLLKDLMVPYPSDLLCASKVMIGDSDVNKQIDMFGIV